MKETGTCCPPSLGSAPLPASRRKREELFARLAKALAHPTRVRIIGILARQRACICGDLVGRLGIPQSTASQHLKMLKDAGLIRGSIDGPRICYCVDEGVLGQFKELAAALAPAAEAV